MWDYYDIKKNEFKFGTSITPEELRKEIEENFKKTIEDVEDIRMKLKTFAQQVAGVEYETKSRKIYESISLLKEARKLLREV